MSSHVVMDKVVWYVVWLQQDGLEGKQIMD